MVRARGDGGGGEEPWSAPRYFAIDYDADALTQTVRRELAAQLRQPEVWREVIQAALNGNRTLSLTPLASAVLMPAAAADTTTWGDGNGMASASETMAISLQAITFLFANQRVRRFDGEWLPVARRKLAQLNRMVSVEELK